MTTNMTTYAPPPAPPGRDETADLLKGFGILAVVAGHCGFPLLLWINPYSFHMPLFFMIAGFFLNFERGGLEFVKGKFVRLVVTYYKYWLAFALLYWAMPRTGIPHFHPF
ncbi:MAG: acyltransferase family protein, partial [Duodenibacillus sp.]|nr:acyltransferase family protein [Duodenibacillus sp.]